MVPSRKHVYISKKSGKYDVYSVDADGKNAKIIVPGTGLERDDIVLIPHPTEPLAALVSTRENVRDSDGFLLSTLYEVDVDSGQLTKIDQSERIQIAGWTGDQRLAYVKIAAGTSANNPKRQRLMTYNAKTNAAPQELASSNSFNDVMMIGDKIYYAPSSSFLPASQQAQFYRVNADGSGQQVILGKEVWNIFRTDYDTLYLSVQQEWYTHKLDTLTAGKVSGPPAQQQTRLYIDSPDKKHSLWIDSRDGKGVLLSYDVAAKKDTTVISASGIKYPAYWLNNQDVIYRVNDGHQSSDYVVSFDGGQPVKIADVTDSGGVETWYYY
jgi:hypothetical protein